MDEAWPYSLNQLAGGTDDADGRPDDPANDCLPTSTAAAIEYLTGTSPYPDSIRDWCYGEGWKGYTFPADMSRYLWEAHGIPSEVIVIDAPQDVIAEALSHGWPVLARTWEVDRFGSYFHWTPVTEFGEVAVRHQVLGGYREVLARAEWLTRYRGYLLVIQQARQ